jgi:hypothetical protein
MICSPSPRDRQVRYHILVDVTLESYLSARLFENCAEFELVRFSVVNTSFFSMHCTPEICLHIILLMDSAQAQDGTRRRAFFLNPELGAWIVELT